MTKPITPTEAKKLKVTVIPDGVIEVVNEMILKNLKGRRATLVEKDVAAAIAKRMSVKPRDVYDNNWLDFEDVYRQAGWGVEYDKPGWNETYDATYKFIAPRLRSDD